MSVTDTKSAVRRNVPTRAVSDYVDGEDDDNDNDSDDGD